MLGFGILRRLKRLLLALYLLHRLEAPTPGHAVVGVGIRASYGHVQRSSFSFPVQIAFSAGNIARLFV